MPSLPSLARLRLFAGCGIFLLTAIGPLAAQTSPAADLTRDAMLVLKAECFSCHNEKKKKGGLVLTSRDALFKGADSGPVIETDQPASSTLLAVLRADADPHMPPKKQLTAAQIQVLRAWVQGGAQWDEAALLTPDNPVRPGDLASLPASYQPVLALALSPDGRRLAVARGNEIIVHDAAEKDYPIVARFTAHRDAVQALAWSADGRWLASGAFRRVVFWATDSWQAAHEWRDDLSGRVTALVFSADSTRLFIADNVVGQSGVVRVMDPASLSLVASWAAHDDTILGLDLSRDGSRLATGSSDRLIKVWDLATRREVARLEGHGGHVQSVAFNSDATQIASAGADRELKVWDVRTREKIISLGNQSSSVTAVCWPGDGAALFAASASGGVVAYSKLKAHTGEQSSKGGDEKKLGDAADAVLALAVPADASVIFSGNHNGTVQAWSRDGKLLAKLAAPAGPAPVISVAPPVSFLRDVLPQLSRVGCSGGSCHAKAEGQNGFKLSVFAYDPKSDYDAIVKGERGRRVFPGAPEQSLLLQKPTAAIDHEGGKRFEPGSELHQLLMRWMREGMAYRVEGEPDLTRIAVTPTQHTYRKNDAVRLAVTAHYSDGSTRDVTKLAAFVSHDADVATVNDDGLVTAGRAAGSGVVVARYMGFVAASHIEIPADRLLPSARYAALPRHNFIDEIAYTQFQRLGLFPSEPCSDAEFLRRAKLDAIGVLPTPDEVRAFLADASPTKRRDAIRRLLDDSAYADHWATKWADLIRPNPDRVGVKSVFTLDQWLRQSFRENKPYDQFVREILLAEGTNHRDGPAVIYRDRREPADRTTMFGQLFLGTRLECARCHNHPNEKWTQSDFFQFAAFFGAVKQKGAAISPPISAGTETFFFGAGGDVKHPVTGEAMKPRPLDGPFQPGDAASDPRHALVASLVAPDNPYFAPAAVNRVWAVFFGRGLVEPVDDFRISNPAVNPPLLAALAKHFVEQRYDMKRLMQTIMESRLYQLSSTPNDTNLADTRNFSRAYRRRLPAEVLLDAVNDATGASDTFAGMPRGTRATQAWTYKIESQFMDAFSRPDPSMDPPCERDTHLSVVQSLHLMNSRAIQTKLTATVGRARQLADGPKSPPAIIEELYLATLSRPPAPDETAVALRAFLAAGATRQTATEDVFWALLNSAEFVFNH